MGHLHLLLCGVSLGLSVASGTLAPAGVCEPTESPAGDSVVEGGDKVINNFLILGVWGW